MRKFRILAFVLVAVCGLCAIAASAAFAAEELPAEYLWEGAKIAEKAELPFLVANDPETSTLLLEDMKATGGAVDVNCSGMFNGVIMGPKDALITEALSLTGSKTISCAFGSNKGLCEGTTATVTAVDLPWLVEPLLVGTTFAEDIVESAEDKTGLPGYKTECETIIGKVSDTCTGDTGAIARNVAGGIESEFSETNEAVTIPGNCTLGGAKEGLLAGVGLITDTAGGTLSISE
jgi:hypothetical protein